MVRLPARIGPAEFSDFCGMIAAGGEWDRGLQRWLIERRRMEPLVRNLRRATDPLFRHAGMSLDEPM